MQILDMVCVRARVGLRSQNWSKSTKLYPDWVHWLASGSTFTVVIITYRSFNDSICPSSLINDLDRHSEARDACLLRLENFERDSISKYDWSYIKRRSPFLVRMKQTSWGRFTKYCFPTTECHLYARVPKYQCIVRSWGCRFDYVVVVLLENMIADIIFHKKTKESKENLEMMVAELRPQVEKWRRWLGIAEL